MITDVESNLSALPWVTRVRRQTKCSGLSWGKVALRDTTRAVEGTLPQDHPALCKRRAKWSFRATKRRRYGEPLARSGEYCTQHLVMEIQDHENEYRRAIARLEKTGWMRRGVLTHDKIGDGK